MAVVSQSKLRKELWYVNSGILSNHLYNNAINIISSKFPGTKQMNATLFLTIDYLIQYFEFASINSTKFVNECIKRHLAFVEKFIMLYDHQNRFIPSKFWDIIFGTFDKFSNMEDLIEKQFSIDALERICNFLTSRTYYWLKSSDSFSYLKVFGRKFKNCVVYNSFMIPKFREYIEPFVNSKHKIFHKIECDCHCKIFLDADAENDCKMKDMMILEVLFDWYQGNFLGFLDCFVHMIKAINPTKHFVKSLRTITRNESMYYSILSDLPMKELRSVEIYCRTGDLISPFLKPNAISKQIFEILKNEMPIHFEETEQFFTENEDMDFWRKVLQPAELEKYKKLAKTLVLDHQYWLIQLKEWKNFKYQLTETPRERFSLDETNFKISRSPETSHGSLNHNKDDGLVSPSTFTFPQRSEKNKNTNMTSPINNGHIMFLKNMKLISQVSKSRQDRLDDLFLILYKRISKSTETPFECLNHTLRVILRCDTVYDSADLEIAKLEMPPCTIYDLLKKYYNFDLKKQTFITLEQRKASFFKRQSLARKQREEIERLEYLQKRQMASAEIEAPAVFDSEEDLELANDVGLIMSPTHEEIREDLLFDEDMLFPDFREKKELLSPEFRKAIFNVLGELSEDILQLFNEKRILALELWHKEIVNNKEDYRNFFPQTFKPSICDVTIALQNQLNAEQVGMINNNVQMNIFVLLKLLSSYDVILDKEFPNVVKGEGIQIQYLNEINKLGAPIPRFLTMIHSKNIVYRKDIYYNICVLGFDIYLICVSRNSAVGFLFDFHRQFLNVAMNKTSVCLRNLFKLFEFDEKLDEAQTLFKTRLHNRDEEEMGKLLKLSQDMRRFGELIYHSTCCKWKQQRCLRILYSSMSLEGNKKCQEPFFRKGGDRRLKKIETKSNCMITMRLTTHPTTGVQIPFVEIFYDFFKGNHFCCIDMLKQMLAENRGSTARLVNARHVLCLPYGELWVMQDLEWLRTRASLMMAQETVN